MHCLLLLSVSLVDIRRFKGSSALGYSSGSEPLFPVSGMGIVRQFPSMCLLSFLVQKAGLGMPVSQKGTQKYGMPPKALYCNWHMIISISCFSFQASCLAETSVKSLVSMSHPLHGSSCRVKDNRGSQREDWRIGLQKCNLPLRAKECIAPNTTQSGITKVIINESNSWKKIRFVVTKGGGEGVGNWRRWSNGPNFQL